MNSARFLVLVAALAILPAATSPAKPSISGTTQNRVGPRIKNPNLVRLVAGTTDLIISELSLDSPTPDTRVNFNLTVTVENRSTTTAATFPAGRTIVKCSAAGFAPVLAPAGGATIPAGQAKVFTLKPSSVQAGSQSWTVTVDPDNVVPETDDANNSLTLTLTIVPYSAPVLPDLIVSAGSITPANPTADDRIMVEVTIKNVGQGPANFPSGAVAWNAAHPDPKKGLAGGTTNKNPLGPGETTSGGIYLIEPRQLASGSYTIRFTADPNNKVPESDETNNTRLLPFTIAGDPNAKPDLVIVSVSTQPAPLAQGVPVVVKNQGAATAYLQQNAVVVSGGKFEARYSATAFVLKSGQTQTLTLKPKAGVTVGPGVFNTVFTVDPNNQVNESNESNNTLSAVITLN